MQFMCNYTHTHQGSGAVDAYAFDIGVINYPSGMSMLSQTDVRRDRAHTRGLVRSSSWVRSSWERAATSAKEKKNTEPTRVSATEAIDIKVYDFHPSAVVLIRDASSSNASNACRAYDEQPPRPEKGGRHRRRQTSTHRTPQARARARAQKPGARAGPTGAKGGAPRGGQRRCGPPRRCTRARSRKARAESEELVIRMDQEWL